MVWAPLLRVLYITCIIFFNESFFALFGLLIRERTALLSFLMTRLSLKAVYGLDIFIENVKYNIFQIVFYLSRFLRKNYRNSY